ncbi:MAG: DUF1223 domain-containing protein [Bacteroidota bacterium]
MNQFWKPFGISLLAATAVAMGWMSMASTSPSVPVESAPVVVVELFTSQGCHSCPSADANLRALVAEAEQTGVQLIPLAFHVDYWNYLGWKDVFSEEAYSLRQRAYAQHLGSGVYTPQMVFNGSSECIGSRKGETRSLIQQALQSRRKLSIQAHIQPASAEQRLSVSYQLPAEATGTYLHIALVETGLEVPIRRGENGGKTLAYDHVVRSYATHQLTDGSLQGQLTLEFAEDVQLSNSKVVAYVQEGEVGAVLGAVQMPVL